MVAVAASYNSGTETPEELIEELISLRLPEVNHLHTIRCRPQKVVSDRDHLDSDAGHCEILRHGLVINRPPRRLP